jgi:hypothetical protein
VGLLAPAACQRLACDATVTRVLATHHPDQQDTGDQVRSTGAARLCQALARLPPTPGGAPSQPLEVAGPPGSSSPPAGRPDHPRRRLRLPRLPPPPGWGAAHHLWHWLHGGPTDLANLALLRRSHHRAVHEGGWRLTRGPDGQPTATPPHCPNRRHRSHRSHRSHRVAA